MNTQMVMLDGEMVAPEKVSPKNARYLGMWRPPVNPIGNPTTDVMCRCGQILRYRGQETEHYRNGCFDVPQYQSLKPIEQ